MLPNEDARWDYLEWIQSGECRCCFPQWDYEGVSVQDLWRWQNEPDFQAWEKFFAAMSEEEIQEYFDADNE